MGGGREHLVGVGVGVGGGGVEPRTMEDGDTWLRT